MTAERHDLVPTALAVEAMRDNGYRNTAYAVAELIDNSLQAGAGHVELLCREQWVQMPRSRRLAIQEIAVLDDGSGMDRTTLRKALQFGNGTRLHDRTGIGRFGMGLPSASISQCRRVDVWSWTEGVAHAIYSYIDLDDVAAGRMDTVPEPESAEIPAVWVQVSKELGRSGTLVVWSNLDRCQWRKGETIIRNSEFVIGRMYRSFLDSGRATIRLAAFDDPIGPTNDKFALANDPGYLMVPTSTPSPYDEAAMFEPDGERWTDEFEIPYNGRSHRVTVRYSIAKTEPRSSSGTLSPGSTLYGKHAAKNVGVSLMRADRELELEQSVVLHYDPRERWWGVEVDFPPSLDEVFGVTNNKQTATNFTEVASTLGDLLSGSDVTEQQLRDGMLEDDDPSAPLVEIVSAIERRLRDMRSRLKAQTVNSRSNRRKRYDDDSAESRGTAATRERQQEGKEGLSDVEEERDEDERIVELAQELEQDGMTPEEAQEWAREVIESQTKFVFTQTAGEGAAFFSVKSKAGEILIKLNQDHPAYENLYEVLELAPDDATDAENLLERLQRARNGLKLLLMAWARYEDEEHEKANRMRLQMTRNDWGMVAMKFLERN
jgi:hypothetical protein